MILYGITEIAREIGISPDTVSVWRTRGKLPEPDFVLAMGPIWKAGTIRSFLERVRKDAGRRENHEDRSTT